MINSFKPLARKDELVTQNLADELLVYDLESKNAHCLNSTSAQVWNYCDGTRSIEEIASMLNSDFELQYSDDIVLLAVQQLESANLLVSTGTRVLPGISRREIIRRAGIAIAVALPIVSSIAIPSNVAASASGVPPGGACVNPVDCQSGLCAGNICVPS